MMDALTTNKSVLSWIEDKVNLVKPDKIVWIDGSKEQIEALRAEACSTGEMIKLNEEKLPDCYLHRTAVNDVARVEARTLICSKKEEDAGPTNNWMDPEKAYKMLYDIARDGYKGRTMYVIPYSMGPVGSPFSQDRHRADRLDLCCAQHVHHDSRWQECAGSAWRQRRLGARPALQVPDR